MTSPTKFAGRAASPDCNARPRRSPANGAPSSLTSPGADASRVGPGLFGRPD